MLEEDEEELLLTTSTVKVSTTVPVLSGGTKFSGSSVVLDDDDDVTFVAPSKATLQSTSLKAQRFTSTTTKASAVAATSLKASTLSASIALETAQTDIDEEAERLRVEVPSDVDVLGDRAAFANWKERQERRRLMGRLVGIAAAT